MNIIRLNYRPAALIFSGCATFGSQYYEATMPVGCDTPMCDKEEGIHYVPSSIRSRPDVLLLALGTMAGIAGGAVFGLLSIGHAYTRPVRKPITGCMCGST